MFAEKLFWVMQKQVKLDPIPNSVPSLHRMISCCLRVHHAQVACSKNVL